MVRNEFVCCPRCGKPSNIKKGPLWMVIIKDILCRFCGEVVIKADRQPELDVEYKKWKDGPKWEDRYKRETSFIKEHPSILHIVK